MRRGKSHELVKAPARPWAVFNIFQRRARGALTNLIYLSSVCAKYRLNNCERFVRRARPPYRNNSLQWHDLIEITTSWCGVWLLFAHAKQESPRARRGCVCLRTVAFDKRFCAFTRFEVHNANMRGAGRDSSSSSASTAFRPHMTKWG